MTDVVEAAVTALNEKLAGAGFDAVVKFVLEGAGSIIVDEGGARAGEGEADVTLMASPDVFQAILAGEENPTAAFMAGKLAVDGDMGVAMRLGALLA